MMLYSPICSGTVLKSLVTNCLNLSTVETPGCKLTLALGDYGDIEVVVPGSEVPLENYGDHVMGLMSSDAHKGTYTLLRYNILVWFYSLH